MNEEINNKKKKTTSKKSTTTKKVVKKETTPPVKEEIKSTSKTEISNSSNMSSEMKNLIVIGIIFIAFLGLLLIPSLINKETKKTINKGTIIDATTAYDYETLLNSSSETVIYLGSSQCGFCTKFNPIINEIVLENDIDVYYYDMATSSDDVLNKIYSSFNSTLLDGFGTPTLLIVKDGAIVTQSVGYKEKSAVLSFFEENNIKNGNSGNTENDKENEDENNNVDTSADYDTSSYVSIDTNKYIELHGKNEYSVIYMGRSTCSACVRFNPLMKSIADKYDVTIYYYDTDKEYDNIYDMAQYNSVILENNSISTPSIFILKDNAVVDHIIGGQDEESIVSLLSKYEIIK